MNLYQKLNKKDEDAYHMYGGMKFRICNPEELSKYRHTVYYGCHYITVDKMPCSKGLVKKRYKYIIPGNKWDYGLRFSTTIRKQTFSSTSIHDVIKLAYHYARKVDSLNESFTRIKKSFIWKPTHVE